VPPRYSPGPLGLLAYRRPGALAWTPQATPPTVQTQMAYRPNYITQQVAKTSYVPETVQQQVPVQVTRMQNEVVSQRVPIQVTRMQNETVTQKVPVQVQRMEAVTETRKVPYTVQRPVTETSTRKVPVKKYRWVTEEKVRKVPVTTRRMVYETESRPVEVRYYEQEKVVRKVRVPKTVPVWVEYEETRMVPRQVVQRTPLNYYDPFSASMMHGYSAFEGQAVPPEEAVSAAKEPVDGESSVLESSEEGAAADDASADEAADSDGAGKADPETRLEGVDLGAPQNKPAASENGTSDAADIKDIEEAPPAADDANEASDTDPVEQPTLGSPVSRRVRYLPVRQPLEV